MIKLFFKSVLLLLFIIISSSAYANCQPVSKISLFEIDWKSDVIFKSTIFKNLHVGDLFKNMYEGESSLKLPVEKVYKGDLKKGDIVEFHFPHIESAFTGGYYIPEEKGKLFFALFYQGIYAGKYNDHGELEPVRYKSGCTAIDFNEEDVENYFSPVPIVSRFVSFYNFIKSNINSWAAHSLYKFIFLIFCCFIILFFTFKGIWLTLCFITRKLKND